MSGFRLFSKWCYCSNDKETYVEALRALQLRRPDLFELLPRICGTRHRTFFARSPRALFPASPHLADVSSHYCQLVPGWYADTNLSNRQKERNLLHACVATCVDYFSDLEIRFEIGHYSPISSQEAARLADKLLLELETSNAQFSPPFSWG